MNVCIVDHQDSFTFNLVHDLGTITGQEPRVVQSQELEEEDFARMRHEDDLVVLSPGPGHPDREEDAGRSRDLIRALLGRVPLFGVCFGLQLLVAELHGKVVTARDIVHGKSLPVHHTGLGVFRNLPSPLAMMRYHSLVAEKQSLPQELRVTAESGDGEVMAVEHRVHPAWAVQFHPESIGSPRGMELLQNVIRESRGFRERAKVRASHG